MKSNKAIKLEPCSPGYRGIPALLSAPYFFLFLATPPLSWRWQQVLFTLTGRLHIALFVSAVLRS